MYAGIYTTHLAEVSCLKAYETAPLVVALVGCFVKEWSINAKVPDHKIIILLERGSRVRMLFGGEYMELITCFHPSPTHEFSVNGRSVSGVPKTHHTYVHS